MKAGDTAINNLGVPDCCIDFTDIGRNVEVIPGQLHYCLHNDCPPLRLDRGGIWRKVKDEVKDDEQAYEPGTGVPHGYGS